MWPQKLNKVGGFQLFPFRLPVGMSRSPALLFDSKQHVCQSFLWYGTLGLVSPHRQTHKCLNSIQKKATVRCLLFCIHDCYADTMHTNICSVARTYTSIMCDYKIKLKTRGGDFCDFWQNLHICWHTLQHENEFPKAVSCDWDTTYNYESQWQQSASFKKGSHPQILCRGQNQS